MNTNSETHDPIAELRQRKKDLRERLKNLSPLEKIIHLEALQERYYEILKIRQENGGRLIPDEWKRWNTAQQKILK